MRPGLAKAVTFLALLSPTAQRAQTPDWQRGVAKISVHRSLKKKPGTAFVVSLGSSTAYLITSAHVVAGENSPTVRFAVAPDQPPGRVTIHKLTAEDKQHGLAILKVERPPAGVKALAPASVPPIGTRVLIAGYPAPDYELEVRDPVISRFDGLDLILSQAAGEGFSGGPVLLGSAVVGLYFGFTDTGKAAKATFVDLYLRENHIPWSAVPEAITKSAQSISPPPLKAGDTKLNSRDGLRYVYVPDGSFQLGCSADAKQNAELECYSDEKPAHRVRITKPFWIGQTEVTVAAYERYRKRAGAPVAKLEEQDRFGRKVNTAGDPQAPVVAVTWDEALGYCAGAGMRLPTNAEWEYAARAGDERSRYGPLPAIAWFGDNSGKAGLDSRNLWDTHTAAYDETLFRNGNGPRRAGTKSANPWNLHDMLGNVHEWVADWYDQRYYERRTELDPKGPEWGTFADLTASSGPGRVLRGGSWADSSRYVRLSSRMRLAPTLRNFNVGFRCAGELP